MKSTNSVLTKQQQWSEQWTSLVIKVVLTVDHWKFTVTVFLYVMNSISPLTVKYNLQLHYKDQTWDQQKF